MFDNIRAHKPEGIENRKAYIIGGGVAGLAGAVFLIDDCCVPGGNATIYDHLPVMGGSMDGAKVGEGRYTCRVRYAFFFRLCASARNSTEVTAAPTAIAATICTAIMPSRAAAAPRFSTSASIAR